MADHTPPPLEQPSIEPDPTLDASDLFMALHTLFPPCDPPIEDIADQIPVDDDDE